MTEQKQYPVKNSVWRHRLTGDHYTVLMVTNENAVKHRRDEYPVTIVYAGTWPGAGPVWSRPLSRWHESFEFVLMRREQGN